MNLSNDEKITAGIEKNDGSNLSAYDLVIAVICAFSLMLCAVRFGLSISTEANDAISFFDNIICAIFFVDFCITMKRSKNRWKYLRTWGWIDILSCIPDVGILRMARISRLFQILRIIRVIKSMRHLVNLMMTRNIENTLLSVGAFAFLAIAGGSCAILIVEKDAATANITNLGDAVWWSFTTITTIGYGDFFPVSFGGRCVAAFLALTGIGLISVFTGSVAAMLCKSGNSDE